MLAKTDDADSRSFQDESSSPSQSEPSRALWDGGVEAWPSPASFKSLLKCHLGTGTKACSFSIATAPLPCTPIPTPHPAPDTIASSHAQF